MGTINHHIDTLEVPTPVCEDRAPQLTIDVVRDIETFASLHETWNTLVEASTATVYQTFEWQYLWWKYFGMHPLRQLHLVLFQYDGRPVGIAPFFLETCAFAGFHLHRRLRLIGCGVAHRKLSGLSALYGVMDYLDIIGLPEYETDVARGLTAYLRDASGLYDEVEFTEVPGDSFIVNVLMPELDRQGFQNAVSRLEVYSRVSPQGDLDEFLRGRSRRFRRHISKAQRTFPASTIESVESADTITKPLQDLIRLHQQRWNRAGFPGLFANKQFYALQQDLIPRLLERGLLWFKMVRMEDQCIAVRLGFVFNGRIYDYLTGFDDEAPTAKHGPGTALMISMIDDAIRQDCTVDLLRGDEAYKSDLTSDVGHNLKIVVPNAATKHLLRVRVSGLLYLWRTFVYRVVNEVTILRVHYRVHGLPDFLFRYATLRTNRLRQIIKVGWGQR